ncbi:hypothetical protein M422DRAFT_45148 [Sphaerobolus stellatus SS14]|nr:hypothetical protein M422DRAFT_45148 [Sphaerobolus stellatus SS14]
MPFLSRLKKLGTLPVTELSTTLTVYLINLEDSEETNIVYSSNDPISVDATIPSTVRFESPETKSKPGDVLIWASRIQKKACLVHACWVWCGDKWVKPVPTSEVYMDHPVRSDYQLVVLSGPYVKWEVKDQDTPTRAVGTPSSTPRATVNSILSNPTGDTPNGRARAAEGSNLQSTPSLNVGSPTPDGSAGFCASDSSNSPLSDLPDTDLPGTETPMVTPQKGSAATSVKPTGSKSASNLTIDTLREKPRGARPSSSRQNTPTATAPPTPVSARPRLMARKSVNPQLKRPQSPVSSASMPASKKRKMDLTTRHSISSLPSFSVGSDQEQTTTADQTPSHRPTSVAPNASNVSDKSPARPGASPTKFVKPLSSQPLQGPSPLSLTVSSSSSTATPSLKVETNDPALPSSGSMTGAQYFQFATDALTNMRKEYEEKLKKATKEREDYNRSTDLYKTQTETELTGLRRKVEEFSNLYEKATAQNQDLQTQLAAAKSAVAKAPAESEIKSYIDERDNLLKALQERAASEAEKDKKLQETLRMLESHQRRAQSFESSLRVAQEAVQRQRMIAQEAEARQKSTISQLAKEILEKDQLAKKLAHDIDDMDKRINELELNVSNKDMAILEEKENVLRTMDELDQLKRTSNDDRAEISRLTEALDTSEKRDASAKSEVDALNAQLAELQSQVSNLQLANLQQVDKLQESERKVKELEKSVVFLEDGRRKAETSMNTERLAREDLEKQLESQLAEHQEYSQTASQERQKIEALLNEQVASLQSQLEAKARELSESLAQSDSVKKDATDFQQYIALADRERKRLEELLAQQVSGLQRELKLRDDNLQAAKSRLDSRTSEWAKQRDQLSRELIRSREEVKELELNGEALRAEFVSTVRKLQDFQRQNEISKADLLKLREELVLQGEKYRQETVDLKEQLAKSVKTREDLQKELSSLSTMFAEYSRNLSAKQAELTHVKEHFKAEEHRLTEQRNAANKRADMADEKLNIARSEQLSMQQKHQAERAQTNQVLKHIQQEADRQAGSFRTEKDRITSELLLLRKEIGGLKDELTKALGELSQSEETLSQEKANSKAERERLSAELSSSKKDIDFFRKQFSEIEKQRLHAQEQLEKQKSAFQEERSKFSAECAGLEKKLSDFQNRFSDAQKRISELEGKVLAKSKDLERKTANLAATVIDLSSERKRTTELSISRAILEKDLEEEKTRLSAANERLKALESELEAVRALTSRLKEEVETERDRLENEQSMTPDSMREMVKSLEISLQREKAVNSNLKEQLSKEQSANYWADLGSQLLRSLHQVQDQLKLEQIAREDLQEQLAAQKRGSPLSSLSGKGINVSKLLS